MTATTSLLVPLAVEAFVVNDNVRLGGNPFMRTQMQYSSLQRYANGQATMSGNDAAFTSSSVVPPHSVPASNYYNGVYLKWRMPATFARGTHDVVSGKTIYPPVPNRWLIVRLGGALSSRQATAWIVESDYVWHTSPPLTDVSQSASMYVGRGTGPGNLPVGVYIGRNVRLGSWTEPGTSLHLTAVAPGNPGFAFYQPQNNNVFSFVDVLGNGPDDTLSYQVFGWFSDAADDPLTGVAAPDFAARLQALNWILPPGTDPTLSAQATLLSGSVCGVAWQTANVPPGGAPTTTSPVSISVGSSSVEALTALVSAQAAQVGPPVETDLLEAFQLNMLDVLDEPDGAAKLADALHASFFQRFSGGYSWAIVDAPGNTEPVSDAEWGKEQAWLAVLSQDQAALDAALRDLVALQEQLYVAWWKYASYQSHYRGSTSIPGLDNPNNLKNLIDPNVGGSIAAQTVAQMQRVQELLLQVPTGDTPEALQAAIAHYAGLQQLPASRELKRAALPSFHLPANPVVLISGAGASGIANDPGPALCRFPSQLVTAFQFSGTTVTAATPGLTVPQPDLSGVAGAPWTRALVTSLIDEFFLTDPSNATAVGAVISGSTVPAVQTAMGDPSHFAGTYPAGAIQSWIQNPWHPLLLIWQVTYYPIAYGTPGAPNWTFDGDHYAWNGSAGSVGTPTSLSGVIQLSSTAAFNMQSRIEAFLQDNPNLDPEQAKAFNELLCFVQTQDNWDLLSQSLNGFNEQLRLGMAGVFLGPDSTDLVTKPPLPTLIGKVDGYPPNLPSIPTGPPPPSNFQPWRSGQFVFTNLLLVDEWGQALWPITPQSQSRETVYLPPDLTPVRISNTVTFAVNHGDTAASPAAPANAGPVITALSPNLMQAGMAPSAVIPVSVSGGGFGSDSVVSWNGIPLPTTIVSDSVVIAGVPANFVMEPGTYQVTVTSGHITSPGRPFTVSIGAAIGTLDPASAVAGGPAFRLTATGVGFESRSVLVWNERPLDTTFVSGTQLAAEVLASDIASALTASVTEVLGYQIFPGATETFIQLSPTLLQPARLNFDLLSAADDRVKFGPSAPSADPVCGWVLPNHLDASLIAYDAEGNALGEMSVGVSQTDRPQIFWAAAPDSGYDTLQQIADAIPHFGPFLLELAQQEPPTFAAFLEAIDETLWTTAPMGAAFDQDLAVLMGRPLAMVRAQLQFELNGAPYADPSWQFTFTPATPAVTGYEFPIELGDVARLNDGLIGYFAEDDYSYFNVVQQAVSAASGYLDPIGKDNNYILLPFDGATSRRISMLVDPRASVHARTALLPTVELSLPPQFVTNALAAMDVTFRVNGALTDQTTPAAGASTVVPKPTILIPVPKQKTGTWSWLENDGGFWTSYATGPNDTTARLSTVAPVLRRGLLRLSSALGGGPAADLRRARRRHSAR